MKKKIPTWLITLLLGGGALAYVMFVFLPGQKKIDQMREEIKLRQSEIVAGELLVQEVASLQTELQDAHTFHASFKTHAPTASNLGNVLGEIQAAATHYRGQLEAYAAAWQHLSNESVSEQGILFTHHCRYLVYS